MAHDDARYTGFDTALPEDSAGNSARNTRLVTAHAWFGRRHPDHDNAASPESALMMHVRARSFTLVAMVFTATSLLLSNTARAQMGPPKPANASSMSMLTPTLVNTDKDGLAMHGYDPVAYFTAGAPTKGAAAFSTTWNGATYQFASAANRDAFVAKPDSYAPQYGGYCAMGITGGAKFDIDPDAWRVENGKLYLNKDKRTQTMWLRDVPGHIVKADTKWPGVVAAIKK